MITPPAIAEAIAAIRELQTRAKADASGAFDYDKVIEGLITYAAACLLVDNRLAKQNSAEVAAARLLDACSWLMKAAVQLRVCTNTDAHLIAARVEDQVREIWDHRDWLCSKGNDDQKTDPHRMMVSHALMNAAGHAMYAGERTAAMNLASRAMEEWSLLKQ